MRRLLLLAAACVGALLSVAGTAAAQTPTTWHLEIHHRETNFPPGGQAEYWFEVANVGDTDSSGPVTLQVQLPDGLTVSEFRQSATFPMFQWSCPVTPGASSLTCTTENSIRQHQIAAGLVLTVDVDPSASGVLTAIAAVEGGGAAEPASDAEPTTIGSAPAGFGIVPGSFAADFYKKDEKTPVRKAGAHPDLATFSFDLNSVPDPSPLWPNVPYQRAPDENLRDVQVELPPGFLGNPTAVDECTPGQLGEGECPRSSQVGRMDLTAMPTQVNEFQQSSIFHYGVFNMTHPRGAIADFAFSIIGNPVHIKASLDPANHYTIRTTVSDINETLPVFNQKLTLWGVPADHSHDWEHCIQQGSISPFATAPCPTDSQPKPFLTLPSRCGVEHTVSLSRYDSWGHPGAYGPELETDGFETTECDKPRFEPDVAVHPTGQAANTPTGLEVHVKVPQSEAVNGLATPPVERFTATFPEGMTVSPSFADGLAGCSQQQIGLETDRPVECPGASRIGTVDLSTPLLPQPLQGSMYLSNQRENPFGTAFGLYLVVHDEEERGVLVKIPGRLDLDNQTGQITTTFDELPQFPFDDLNLAFRSGPRAPLVSPPTCGSQTIGVEVASWAQPDNPVQLSNAYDVSEGPEGTPCPRDLASRPFAPKMEAGVVNPSAGVFSPFVFRLTRGDSDQELNRIGTTLPKGLLAKIAGVGDCPDAALASISSEEGSGRAELEHPACPASSEIGNVFVGMGAGTGPDYFHGKAYLAGPYKGAPLSLAVVTPAIAGPFDFGSVVVRAAIHVDPESSQVRVASDPIPTILHGVLLRVRDVRVLMDRPESMINPTSCAPTSVDGLISGGNGALASLSNRFQVGDCASLGFKPKLALRLNGGTHRGDYPALTATLTARKGDANIGRAAVTLPHSEFLEQAHIGTVCTRVQYAAKACPAASIYGYAKATSPLLDEPLEGPVYLRSSNNPLPDLVASLDGRVHLDLVGRIDAVHGGIRTTFASVPDAPVTEFTLKMKGGKKSLLVNSRNLCGRPTRAQVKLGAHNGQVSRSHPLLKTGCRKALTRRPDHRPTAEEG
jgi:hypothetical protein